MGNFVVYKSSAGSGKTFTLVKEYLKICLSTEEDKKFREVLAITFTNKAAAEMKSRIIEALQNLSGNNPQVSVLKEILLNELPVTEEQLVHRSQVVLDNILHSYADFAVSTIDKFTYKLVRVFARDLRIPINFEVELDQENLLRKVIDLLIDQVGRSEEITNVLVDFVKSKTEEESSWQIEKDIFDFAKDLLGEKGSFFLPALRKLSIDDFRQCRKEYVKLNKEFLKNLAQIGEEATEIIEKNFLESSLKVVIPKFFLYLKASRLDMLKPNKSVVSSFESAVLYPQTLNKADKANVDAFEPQLSRLFEKAMNWIEEEHPLFVARAAAIKNLYSIALLNEIEKLFEKIKQEDSIIHISDFNKRIAEVVNSEPIPFIYERLGEKYKHFMIDEFQDTSVLQYQNLMPLLENTLAEDNFNMLVGDSKQAIYRWRGGEVEQFSLMPDYLHASHSENTLMLERQQSIAGHYEELTLTDNYRSAGNLVNFNNQFFSSIKNYLSPRIQQIFQANEQNIKRQKDAGYIKVEFVSKEKELYEATSLQKILESIHACVEDGFDFKDIAILCRSNKKAIVVANHLIQHSVAVISSESLLISNSSKVKFLIDVFHLLLEPKEKKYQKNIVEFLVHEESLQGGFHSNYQKWLHSNQNFDLLFKHMQIDFSAHQLIRLPLYELCESLVRLFGFHKEYDLYIQFFLESVYNFSIKFGAGLSSFLEWWEENSVKISLDVPDYLDAVKIMTIHKSKGLEFPVVIYPFADDEISKRTDNIWVEVKGRIQPSPPSVIIPCGKGMLDSIYREEVAEELDKKTMDLMNETYVAFTRAVDRLYVFSRELPQTSELNTLPQLINRALEDFPNYSYIERKYESGTAGRIQKTKVENTEEQVMIPEFISISWENRLLISREAPADWSSDNILGPRQYGNLIHKILAEISVKGDIQKVISDFNVKGLLTEEESPDIERELYSLLENEKIAGFFKEGLQIRKEEAILTPKGESYRPDRVVYREGKVQVVDFKSGQREESHQIQLRNYMLLIHKIENLETNGYLIYLNEREVVEVF